MAQRSVRFPDDLEAAIEAESSRRGRPHSFSSVLVEVMRLWADGRGPSPGADVASGAAETPAMARQRKLNDAKGKR